MSAGIPRGRLWWVVLMVSLVVTLMVSIACGIVAVRASHEVDQLKSTNLQACLRGNVRRANDRFVLRQLKQISIVVSQAAMSTRIRSYFESKLEIYERKANSPSVQPQPCRELYG